MKNNFCKQCPRGLARPPTEICPMGREHAMSAQEGVGCPWGIASATHGYCFWTYIAANSDPDGRMDPVPDQEICAILGISRSALDKTSASAIAKLRAAKNSDDLKEFRQSVIDRASGMPDDNTIYMPDNFRIPLDDKREEEELPEELKEIKKRRKDRSMPIHRDGKKIDLYGLGRRKK